MVMIACIFLMTTTIKGRGHDVARALSGFVCFPAPPIHDPPINKVFVFFVFIRTLCTERTALESTVEQSCEKAKYFLRASQQNSIYRYIKEGLHVWKPNSTFQIVHLSKPKFCDMLQWMFYSLRYGAQMPL